MEECLLAPKVTEEIARTRGIEVGKDCISPAKHKEFSTPLQNYLILLKN